MLTIVDVAQKAGVSPTTVSRVINDHPSISEKTRGKVFRAMRELNYFPNEAARSLTTKRTHIIGLIVPIINHPYFALAVGAIEKACADAGYKLLICTTDYSQEKERGLAAMLRANRVDGVIIYSQMEDVSTYSRLNLPAVTIDREVAGVHAVLSNNHQGGYLAAKMLIEGGCRHPLAFGFENLSVEIGRQRYQGFRDACRELGVESHEEIVDIEHEKDCDISTFFQRLMERYPETDCVFTTNDTLASKLMLCCGEMGISIPNDLQLIGYDGTYIAELLGITTVTQPIEQMCAYALNILLKQVEGEIVPQNVLFPVTIAKRRTTRQATLEDGTECTATIDLKDLDEDD